MSEPPLIPWIIANKNGNILAAQCNCMAGLGEACSHVAATLFWIETTVRIRDSKTVTQEKAYWMLPSGISKVPYCQLREIDFTSSKSKKLKLDTCIASSHSNADDSTPTCSYKRKAVCITEPNEKELHNFF